MKNPVKTFEPGDVVRLHSSQNLMTVTAVVGIDAALATGRPVGTHVLYFDNSGILRKAVLPAECLTFAVILPADQLTA